MSVRLKGSRVLEVELDGSPVKTLTGSMVAYDGEVDFKKSTFGGEGIRGALKRKVTGESLDLMDCTGSGTVWFASEGREIGIIPLRGDTLLVESSSLLAVIGKLQTNVSFTGLRGATSGNGLFTTSVSGEGTVAIVSDGPPITLGVSGQYPLVVDPDAYLGHKAAQGAQLNQSFITDVSWKSFVGEGSGEAFSLRFEGTGEVFIQPAER